MAGNTIYMQEGSNYIDIHDNEVVNLHIDKATVHLQDDADARQKAAALTENAEFMQILQRAVEAGFCSPEEWQYRWKVKVEAAYFASVASHRFGLSDRRDHEGDVTVSWIPFEALFGVKDLRLSYNDYQKCATKVRRKAAIDSLFR